MSVSLASPVQPHEMDKRMRRGFEELAERVLARALLDDSHHDIILRVYLAGVYHGAEAEARRKQASHSGATE